MPQRQRPPADLAVRPNSKDEELTVEQIARISLFAELERQPELGEQPGTIILRCFNKGDVICRLGDPGWTAFYILTARDLLELHSEHLPSEKLQHLKQRVSAEARDVALVVRRLPSSLWERLRESPLIQFVSKTKKVSESSTLKEGELFGEVSCRFRVPRTATVTVTQDDCYMLEMYRNVFEKMYTNRNKAFKEMIDTNYRNRVFELHLRAHRVFELFDPDLVRRFGQSQKVKMIPCEPGDLICDEHDHGDGMYLIRSGFVKVMKGSSFLLSPAMIPDWGGFCAALLQGIEMPVGPRRRIWDRLREVHATLFRAGDGEELTTAEKQQVVEALNELLKQPRLSVGEEFKEMLRAGKLTEKAVLVHKHPENFGIISENPADEFKGLGKWKDHQQVRGLNREIFEILYPGFIRTRSRPGEDIRVLAYRSEGEFIGEQALTTGHPRSATCLAYDHPEIKHGGVELMKISRPHFEELLNKAPEDVQERVKHLLLENIESRARQTAERMARPAWDDTGPAAQSARFEELGLIQGRKLMLIDLDRCTRCDECVKACIATHDDGRSRLFLDGPRFKVFEDGRSKSYLVPTTCRQCKDPLCLIGCPVGSIHPGNTGQIVIENWCIGCSKCSEMCPYGAIQMHKVGIIPRGSRQWRCRTPEEGSPCSAGWEAPSYRDDSWNLGQAPFLRKDLENHGTEVHFRHSFDLRPDDLEGGMFLHALSKSPDLTLWINGRLLLNRANAGGIAEKSERGEKYNFELMFQRGILGPKTETSRADMPDVSQEPWFRTGGNNLSVRVAVTKKPADVLLELGLYRLAKPVVKETDSDVDQERILNRAVVCDMCSSTLFGSHPACVRACPHEATFRDDPRIRFKIQ